MFFILSFLPFSYLFYTRLKGIFHKLSWVCLYYVPVVVLYLYFTHGFYDVKNFIRLFVILCIVDMVYTNGYIQNDVLTTKQEKNPTIRLPLRLLLTMRSCFVVIIIGRAMLITFFFIILYYFDESYCFTLGVVMIGLQVLYFVYNSQRSIINLLLIPLLSFIRFFGIIFAFIDQDPGIVIWLFLLYPFPKFLEFSTQERYITARVMKNIIRNFDVFRVVYYLIYTLVVTGVWLQGAIDWIIVIMGLYFLCFRILCLLAITQETFSGYIQDLRYKNNPHKK